MLERDFRRFVGPLPSKNHIVVIQDLTSHYPIAKLVQSINAKSTISVLEDVYDTFGNLIRQKSDNGPCPILRKWKILVNIEILNRLKHH